MAGVMTQRNSCSTWCLVPFTKVGRGSKQRRQITTNTIHFARCCSEHQLPDSVICKRGHGSLRRIAPVEWLAELVLTQGDLQQIWANAGVLGQRWANVGGARGKSGLMQGGCDNNACMDNTCGCKRKELFKGKKDFLSTSEEDKYRLRR